MFFCFWILLHTLLGNCEKNEGKFDCEFVILSVCCQWNRQYRWFTPGKTEKEITWPLFLAVTLFDNLICWCFVFPFVVLIKVLFFNESCLIFNSLRFYCMAAANYRSQCMVKQALPLFIMMEFIFLLKDQNHWFVTFYGIIALHVSNDWNCQLHNIFIFFNFHRKCEENYLEMLNMKVQYVCFKRISGEFITWHQKEV